MSFLNITNVMRALVVCICLYSVPGFVCVSKQQCQQGRLSAGSKRVANDTMARNHRVPLPSQATKPRRAHHRDFNMYLQS